MIISDDGSGTTVSNNGIVTSISVDLIYPIGSIYTSINSTSPASLFGGTWVAIGTSGSNIIETGTSGIWTYRNGLMELLNVGVLCLIRLLHGLLGVMRKRHSLVYMKAIRHLYL